MGIRSLFSNIKNKVGDAVGRGLKKLGEAVGSRKLEEAGLNLQIKCNFGYTSWNESSSVSRTVDVHKELSKVTKDVESSASAEEAKLIEICVSEIAAVLDELLTLIPCSELYRLQENYRIEIESKLSGQLMKLIQPRLSLDDKECKQVLEIYDDAERKQKAADFTQKVLKTAERKFKARCSSTKMEYYQMILDIAGRELQSAQAEVESQKDLLRQMLMDGRDEQIIDFEREHALITIEKLSALNSIAFDLS